MSHYHAIFTDHPLEKMLEKHPERLQAWIYSTERSSISMVVGDSWKHEPNGADKLRLTEYYYFEEWGFTSEVLCLADDYLKKTYGKIYVIKLSLSDDMMKSWKISEEIEIIDLKNISEKIRNNSGRMAVDLEPYIIYDVMNSEYKNE